MKKKTGKQKETNMEEMAPKEPLQSVPDQVTQQPLDSIVAPGVRVEDNLALHAIHEGSKQDMMKVVEGLYAMMRDYPSHLYHIEVKLNGKCYC